MTTHRRRMARTQLDSEVAAEEEATTSGQETGTATEAKETRPAATNTAASPATSRREEREKEEEEEPGESRRHLVKHRAPRAEVEEEQFDSVYKRDTYYIDRTYIKRLKQLIKDSQRTKTYLMNEALDLLFEKYNVE